MHWWGGGGCSGADSAILERGGGQVFKKGVGSGLGIETNAGGVLDKYKLSLINL